MITPLTTLIVELAAQQTGGTPETRQQAAENSIRQSLGINANQPLTQLDPIASLADVSLSVAEREAILAVQQRATQIANLISVSEALNPDQGQAGLMSSLVSSIAGGGAADLNLADNATITSLLGGGSVVDALVVNNLASANQTISQATNLQAVVNSQTVAQGELVDSIVAIRSGSSAWLGVSNGVVLENSTAGTAVLQLRYVSNNQTTEDRNGVSWTITPWWEHETQFSNTYSAEAGNTVNNRVGSLGLNADGTLEIQGSYTDLNATQQAAVDQGGFTKVFTGGYGNYAAQRSDGSLLVFGYNANTPGDASVLALLAADVVDVQFNYGAGGARLSDGSVVTWGHQNYQPELQERLSPGVNSYRLSSTNPTQTAIPFEVDPNGQISISSTATAEQLNFEGVNQYGLTLEALRTDGTVVASKSISINLQDVNESPQTSADQLALDLRQTSDLSRSASEGLLSNDTDVDAGTVLRLDLTNGAVLSNTYGTGHR